MTDSSVHSQNDISSLNDQIAIRKAEIRADLWKWIVGSVALTLITTIGNWTFQYFSLRAEAEKTNRELKIKEKDMQLQYLDKFTGTAIDQDIRTRIRLAHYISKTIDDKEYEHLADRWRGFYDELVNACKTQLDRAKRAGRTDVEEQLSDEPACTVGGTETLVTDSSPKIFDLQSGPGGVLGELMARGETGRLGYNAYNRGNAGEANLPALDLSSMKVKDIVALQALPPGNNGRLFAVGKYSFLPMTLRSAIDAQRLDPEEKFSPTVQERVFRTYILDKKRPNIKNYIAGSSNNLLGAQFALALEYASVADPSTGRSHYGIGNHASVSAQETAQALAIERTNYQQLISQGKTPEEAWTTLSPGIAESGG